MIGFSEGTVHLAQLKEQRKAGWQRNPTMAGGL